MIGVLGVGLGFVLWVDAQFQYLAPPLLIVWAILGIISRNRIQELEQTIKDLHQKNRSLTSQIEALEIKSKSKPPVPIKARTNKPKKDVQTKAVTPSLAPKPKPKKPVETASEPAKIATANSAISFSYVTGREWSAAEIRKLALLYKGFSSTAEMSSALQREPKEVVVKLAEVVFGLVGELEDVSQAPNNQNKWSRDRRIEMSTRFNSGESIDSLARRFGRTRLAIVWQLINIRAGDN